MLLQPIVERMQVLTRRAPRASTESNHRHSDFQHTFGANAAPQIRESSERGGVRASSDGASYSFDSPLVSMGTATRLPENDVDGATLLLVGTSEAKDQSANAEQQGRVLKVELQEAAARLPDLVNRVRRGENVVLSDGEFEVRLVLLPTGRRVLGQDAGLFEVPEDFDEPLPDAVLDAFGS